LLLANAGPQVIDNAADYVSGRFQNREGRSESEVILCPESGVPISADVVARLLGGTGLRFNLNRATTLLADAPEPKRRRLLQAAQGAVGFLGNGSQAHTRWSQKPSGRLYSAGPALTNLPKLLRPAWEPISSGVLAEVDYQNFETRILHSEAGLKAPDGDFAALLGADIGLTKNQVKDVLNPMLHGQTCGNLVGRREWERIRHRELLVTQLKRVAPELLRQMELVQRRPDLLQHRGAQVFSSAYENALAAENVAAGIPLHDGWVFAAENRAQALRIKRIFEDTASGLLDQPMPVSISISE